ncbi:MAG: 50S ribosomal protein L10e [Candidatus Micrarchaeota archaeon]|nr:MAG: 50S ribosomal protein L10e [Candidatus Micrarchaeota archaeon]
MVRLRPARTVRSQRSQAWARFSRKMPKKNYVKARPASRLQVFKTGVEKNYECEVYLKAEDYVQLRSNALEAAREAANSYLFKMADGRYLFRVLVYPHIVLREHKLGSFAGADRTSRGMVLAFGRPVGVAARVDKNQSIFLVKVNRKDLDIVKEAYRRAKSKLSGRFKIDVVYKDSKENKAEEAVSA